jgi:gamma-glutamylcyclotransferase (GGCT)/AIG2-like uncharacterized protein YtfP
LSPSLAIAARPLDVAAMIPLAAAGRQPLFFFGTLMDLDVLAYLLERPVDLDDLKPASITGFCRVRAVGASYPVLVPQAGGVVEGRLLRRATARDIARINHYESEEYLAELRHVVTADTREVAAWLYLGLDHLEASDEPWSLEDWQRRDKAGFFAACDGWMDDFRGDA